MQLQVESAALWNDFHSDARSVLRERVQTKQELASVRSASWENTPQKQELQSVSLVSQVKSYLLLVKEIVWLMPNVLQSYVLVRLYLFTILETLYWVFYWSHFAIVSEFNISTVTVLTFKVFIVIHYIRNIIYFPSYILTWFIISTAYFPIF